MLAAARSDPESLVVGIDADAASMREASQRAARNPVRGGAPNAIFVVSAVEALPVELAALADDVRVHFPWGSLLRGLLHADPTVVEPIARLARPGGSVTVLLSVTGVERHGGLPALDARLARQVAAGLASRGLTVVETRPATDADVRAARSSWGKRLQAGSRRDAWLLRFVRR